MSPELLAESCTVVRTRRRWRLLLSMGKNSTTGNIYRIIANVSLMGSHPFDDSSAGLGRDGGPIVQALVHMRRGKTSLRWHARPPPRSDKMVTRSVRVMGTWPFLFLRNQRAPPEPTFTIIYRHSSPPPPPRRPTSNRVEYMIVIPPPDPPPPPTCPSFQPRFQKRRYENMADVLFSRHHPNIGFFPSPIPAIHIHTRRSNYPWFSSIIYYIRPLLI